MVKIVRGACANTIAYALRPLDPKVKVSADVKTQTLRVDSTHSQEEISALIEEAGYPVLSGNRISS